MAATLRCPIICLYFSFQQQQQLPFQCSRSGFKAATPSLLFSPESVHGLSTLLPFVGLATAGAVRLRAKKSGGVLPPVDNWSFEERMKEALEVLNLMQSQGMRPDPSSYCILLKSCADSQHLAMGTAIHQDIRRQGLESDVFVANNLIALYAACGCLREARQVFDRMPQRTVVSWTSIISAYLQLGRAGESLMLYDEMVSQKIQPNVFTYAAVLKSCAKMQDLEKGREIHQRVVKECCDSDSYIRVALVDMYSKCGRMEKALGEFEKIPEPSPVAFTAMIQGYNNLKNGAREAIDLIRRMLHSGADEKFIKEVGFSCMIRSCTQLKWLKQGQEIHAHLIKTGYDPGPRASAELVEVYVQCGKTRAALSLFSMLHIYKPAHLWGALIFASVTEGLNWDALTLFYKMLHENVKPDSSLMFCVVRACVRLPAVEEGKQIHGHVIKTCYKSLDDSVVVGLINLCNRSAATLQA